MGGWGVRFPACCNCGRTPAAADLEPHNNKPMHDTHTPGRYFYLGASAVVPILPGVAPFGLISGIAAVESGLSPTAAWLMSAMIFAGASQLAAVQLMADNAAIWIVLLTVWVINLRFAMYSASLAPHLRHVGTPGRLMAAFLVTDHGYGMSVLRFDDGMPIPQRLPYYLGIGVTLWVVWQATTLAGALLGKQLPPDWSLDFAIPLTFLALLIPTLRGGPTLAAGLTGGVVAVVCAALPYNLGLIAGAVCGIAAGVMAEALSSNRPWVSG